MLPGHSSGGSGTKRDKPDRCIGCALARQTAKHGPRDWLSDDELKARFDLLSSHFGVPSPGTLGIDRDSIAATIRRISEWWCSSCSSEISQIFKELSYFGFVRLSIDEAREAISRYRIPSHFVEKRTNPDGSVPWRMGRDPGIYLYATWALQNFGLGCLFDPHVNH